MITGTNRLTPRPHYTQWLERWRDKDVIKVITGLRRCGKSTILELFRNQLQGEGVSSERILSINFESMERQYPAEPQELYDYIVKRLQPHVVNYVFLDEIQHVEHFERAIDGLYVRDDVDLYITGSNANLLSSELATLLTGRYVELRMLPLSFAEYRSVRATDSPTGAAAMERDFDAYLNYGGLPYAAMLDNEQDIADYLGGVFNTILMADIAQRNPRMDMRAFNDTASFLADNIGNRVSLKRIAGAMNASGRRISPTTVSGYVDAMTRNYLLFRAGRYDLQGKGYLATEEKLYLGDLGLRFWLLGKQQGDLGHRIENVVYLELLRRYTNVSIGKWGAKEVDFVATDSRRTHYYQVAQTVLDPSTLERELAPLQALQDNHPKTLLTLDRMGLGDYQGIEHINLLDWLTEQG